MSTDPFQSTRLHLKKLAQTHTLAWDPFLSTLLAPAFEIRQALNSARDGHITLRDKLGYLLEDMEKIPSEDLSGFRVARLQELQESLEAVQKQLVRAQETLDFLREAICQALNHARAEKGGSEL